MLCGYWEVFEAHPPLLESSFTVYFFNMRPLHESVAKEKLGEISLIEVGNLGGWLGSHSAIKGGDKFIRKILIFVLLLMLIANVSKILLAHN